MFSFARVVEGKMKQLKVNKRKILHKIKKYCKIQNSFKAIEVNINI